MMANDNALEGVAFPQDYDGLLRMTQNNMLINRRLVAIVGNQDLFIQDVLRCYQSEDALALHKLLDEYLASLELARAVQRAQAAAGINYFFPTVQ